MSKDFTKEEILEKLKERTRIDPITNCWIWLGCTNWAGYGRTGIGGNKTELVHRIGYKILVGEPKNLVLHNDKLCYRRNCWNPEHLYDGTISNNTIDRYRRYPRKLKSHCKRGHEMTGENIRIYNGVNSCRACHKMRQKQYDLRRKV